MKTDQIAERRIDLDWLRIAAFGLLILYHVGMLYVPWTFHVKSVHAGPALEPLMLAVNPWRLGLLFLISGVASRFMLQKVTAGGFARQRSARLLIPLLFGMLVIVPPQSYFEVAAKYGFTGSFLDFYLHDYLGWMHMYRTPSGVKTGLILPTWNHLWFVVYLWVYTLVAAVVALSPRGLNAIEGLADRHVTPLRLIVVPIALLIAYRLTLSQYPMTRALFDDPYGHALYFTMFAIGFVIARSDRALDIIERLRWPALSLAVASYVAFIALRGKGFPTLGAFTYGINEWTATLTILGFGRRYLGRSDGPVRRYLTDAIFPYYIVHQTALIALAVWLKPFALPAFTEFAAIVIGTAFCCAITYEIVRRVPLLRAPFGLRRSAAAKASPQPPRPAHCAAP
ncbi:glucans biosynthesis protein C [Variibacter gotjawalensis]|uniref:Glucans biosynthesis protein C n=1 Tax=Variibacter gotjawalensis TaxID=1333996 RepID=A0A0S3PQ17_9BRAD|nr:acyltransferase family protein [Variibacter gotjawalensis]NIK48307.1 membrane-bound acyltransferase YfiQ involved in biofilm formation [Variibacter gotjawalensis]RZS50179.1 acyltransferase-like protein [Variibacter gotjawalensis]BAT58009.1 glucans biosynthesis protein C [Variibacter gotjawalensis]